MHAAIQKTRLLRNAECAVLGKHSSHSTLDPLSSPAGFQRLGLFRRPCHSTPRQTKHSSVCVGRETKMACQLGSLAAANLLRVVAKQVSAYNLNPSRLNLSM